MYQKTTIAMADSRSDLDRASELFLNYMTSCALGETSVESESGGCEGAVVHHRLASLHIDGSCDAGERYMWLRRGQGYRGQGPLTTLSEQREGRDVDR